MNKEILALSGFLGLPQDWDFLNWNDLWAVDWQDFSFQSLTQWASHFNQWVSQQDQKARILMGYSLGGRLALHALIDQPQQWQAAVIISTHPGLTDSQECQNRLCQDQVWAKRFESEDWKSLIEAWNKQAIFAQDSFAFERKSFHYQRNVLVKALLHGSLGKQANLRDQIAQLHLPILWMTGNLDQYYCQLAQTIAFKHPYSQWKKIENAGHRFPWSQPQIFAIEVMDFLNRLSF